MIPSKSMTLKLTKEQATSWLKLREMEQPYNPVTRRQIKKNGSTYKKLDSLCKKIFNPKEKIVTKTNCRVWEKFDIKKASGYGVPSVITCKGCHGFKSGYMVHDSLGDYLCDKCDEEIKIIYYCLYCKRSTEDFLE